MEISVYKPSSPLLKLYIKYFYILRQHDPADEITYLTFPNANSMLSITNNVDVVHSLNKIHVNQNPKIGLISDLTMAYSKPLLIKYRGIIKEITICFKPLGIHSFDPNLRAAVAPENAYYLHEDYKKEMGEIFELEDNEEMIAKIEAYLLAKYQSFAHPFLTEFVKDIGENPNSSLEDLSSNYGVSQKTLIKHSKLYFHRTPSEFKRVVRLHTAIAKYMNSERRNGGLTDISHAAHFFDQAHMIKDFRALTGLAPSEFFKNLNPVKGEFNWMFL